MARTFVAASSQYCEATTGPLGTAAVAVFSLACWFKPSAIANGTALGVGSSASGSYAALGMNGSGATFFEVNNGAGADTVNAGTFTNGTWAHIAGVQSGNANRLAYFNGTAGTANTAGSSPAGMDRIDVGGLLIAGSRVSFLSGDIGECAIWNIALSGADVTTLAGGALPSSVQAASLVGYWKITGTDSPELDSSGAAISLTVVGATAAGSNPPVIGGNPPIVSALQTAGASYAAQRAANI